MDAAEIQLAVAHIRLLHMTVYSRGTLSMIFYGVSKAKTDDSFFEESIRSLFPSLDDASVSEIAAMKKEMDLELAIKGGQAGSLVFMHAGIEWCLVAVAKAIAEVSPNAFLPLLKSKQVSLQEALSQNLDELLTERIDAFLHLMDRQSLVERTRTIFRLINDSDLPRGIFDEARVDRIERLRNDCAHGRVDVADFSTINDDLDYLRQIGEFFIDTVAAKFGIPYSRRSIEELK